MFSSHNSLVIAGQSLVGLPSSNVIHGIHGFQRYFDVMLVVLVLVFIPKIRIILRGYYRFGMISVHLIYEYE